MNVRVMDTLLKFLRERGVFWWINEVGILLEIIGAAVLVIAAFKSRNQIKDIQNTWNADLAVRLRDTIAAQAYTELKGFIMLAIGLACQMIGGFGS